ncbi:MAG TPA: DEAD/DEAH box helicase, partial [Nocardioidaceae bacterium]
MTGRFQPRPVETPEQLRRLMQEDFTFSDQQFAVITAPLSPHVVVAGAGSGKTTVMAARVVWLVATGQVRPDQVLGLTFTTKAAGELATRIRAGLRAAGVLPVPGDRRGTGGEDAGDEPEVEEPTVATYNAYAAGLLTEHGLRIGHEPDTRVIADASRYQLAARAIARHDGRVELLSDHPPTVINDLLALDGAMAEHLLTPADLRAFHARQRPLVEEARAAESLKTRIAEVTKVLSAIDRREELLGLVEAYRRLKAQLGLMDFSDQIALGARLAAEQPEVGAAEREKYPIVLLDEYQDTSVAQATMLSRLFSGDAPDSGRGHAVTAVGDPNQAIYGWRGASVSNILGFGRDFPRADGSVEVDTYSLTVNRRSDARILEVANALAAPLYSRMPQVARLEPKPGAAPGTVRSAVLETYADELAWLAQEVMRTHAAMGEPAWSRIGVLTRDNAHAADVFDALTEAEIPVEIVGLQGLLRLPEVAEVVATLTLLHDLTANAELLTLLTGPRWAVGARDLALLGRRARHLAGSTGPAARATPRSVEEELAEAIEGADPTEVVSLSDALDDPGDLGYSPQALERFALLSRELRELRAYAGEPLLDLVRRIVDTTGIDVELASSVSPAAQARRENLDLFVKAVADFQALDGDVSLPALLAYLQAEDEHGNGLDVATPTEADSVKLLTVHRAKGLEWDAVLLVGVADERFPTSRTRTKWTAGPGVLPYPLRGDTRDLPALTGYAADDLKAFAAACKEHELEEELRLGYVAFTRARHLLAVSSYCWSPTRQRPLGPSAYQQVVRERLTAWGESWEPWLDKPPKGEPNPLRAGAETRPWPVEAHTAEVTRRAQAAALVRTEVERLRGPHPVEADAGLTAEEAARVEVWDDELERLLEEARAGHADEVEVALPSSLSATSLARLRDDPQRLAAELARPMPRKPSPAARFGTRFHAWLESRFGQQQLVGLDEVPGRGDEGIDDEAELADLVERFTAGPFGD